MTDGSAFEENVGTQIDRGCIGVPPFVSVIPNSASSDSYPG